MVIMRKPPEIPDPLESSTPDRFCEAINYIGDVCHKAEFFGSGRWADEAENYGYPEVANWIRTHKDEFYAAYQQGPAGDIVCESGVRIRVKRYQWR